MLSKFLVFAASFAVDGVFFINLCSWIFKCGCKSLWAGADMACNIHMAQMKHCPFCAHGWQGQAGVMAAIWIPQVFIAFRSSWSWPVRLTASLAVFPVVESIAALVIGTADGYWNR